MNSFGFSIVGFLMVAGLMSPSSPPEDGSGIFDVRARHASGATEIEAKKSKLGMTKTLKPGITRFVGGKVLPRERLALPACRGNELPANVVSDVLCSESMDLCSDTADPRDRMFWIYLGPPGVARPGSADWVPSGQTCLSPEKTGSSGRRAVPTVTAEDFRRLPLPAGRVHVQPESGRTLVNIPTNVWVEAGPIMLPASVLGAGVQVRATPAGYAWSFGDGGVLKTADPGAPYPNLRTTHTYTRPGTVNLVLTTTYRGEFAVSGGPWIPIEGTASVASVARQVTVIEARAALVEDSIAEA